MEEYFKYKLKKPIKVDKDGEQIEADALIVLSPIPADTGTAMALEAVNKQAMYKAMKNFKALKDIDNTENIVVSETTPEEKAQGIMEMFLSGASKDDIDQAYLYLEMLLCSGGKEMPQASINGVQVTKHLFAQFGLKDKKMILGGYLNSFLSEA